MKRLLAAVFGFLFAAGCNGNAPSPSSEPASQWSVGGIYSIDNGDSSFRIVKVLAFGPGVVHVRVYKNKFEARPESVDLDSLTLGTIHDADGFGMGHLPISAESFVNWQPVFISQSDVTEDELEGYTMWKEAGGGVFN